MEIRQLSNDQKVDILINQIVDNYDQLFNQIEKIEDDYGYEGTWIIYEILNYPQYKEEIDSLADEFYEFGPTFRGVLSFILDKMGIYHIPNVDISNTEEICFNDQNIIDLILPYGIEKSFIFKIINDENLKCNIKTIEHFIDDLENMTVDQLDIIRHNNENGDIYLMMNEGDGYINDYSEIYEFMRKNL